MKFALSYGLAVKLRVSALPVVCSAMSAALVLAACGGSDSPAAISVPAVERSVGSLRLIGQQIISRRTAFGGTTIGGLSGIDYDVSNDRYVLISDDRTTADSASAPRMYTARLNFDASSFGSITFLSTLFMKQPDGTDYPKVLVPNAAGVNVPDPESVRVDPVSGNYLWVSEGARTFNGSTATAIISPFIREITPGGAHVREYALPPMFQMSSIAPGAAGEIGPRNNLVFEGISVTPDRSKTVVIMEGALVQDSATPTTTSGSLSRITVFDRATGVAAAQYAYPIERVQVASVPAGQFTVNGPTEILAITNTKFLVLERSFSVGVDGNQVRLYQIDISNATNILTASALTAATFSNVTKTLVLDFETLKSRLGNNIANLEGMTFGPRLANGNITLIVVADDNFPQADSVTDFNQFLVFEVLP